VINNSLPIIIQGGMGAGVSAWQLARAVSLAGQLGVVSGTALDTILSRRLQNGDPGGHMRRALAAFPISEMADRVLADHFIPGGKPRKAAYRPLRLFTHKLPRERLELIVLSNFAEVHLAKEGHGGLVGINYLEKIQLPTLPSLLGAMLAGVDYVLMGAGIPVSIPAAIDALCAGTRVALPLSVEGTAQGEGFRLDFDPAPFLALRASPLQRPKFVPIVASASLANVLLRRSSGPIDGFVVEGPTAGGHNAPPRGRITLNDCGEPVYGERDVVSLDEMLSLNRPFWLAGSYGRAEKVVEALAGGAAGVQVGTAFAFCDESGLRPDIKGTVIERSRAGRLDVFTDPIASPTGFPFKVLQLEGTLSDGEVYQDRQRRCDLGYLRQAFKNQTGGIGWRCPGEPVSAFVSKGGTEAQAAGRKCLCNALVANIGLEQMRKRGGEPPLITCGDDVNQIHQFLPHPGASSYSAQDVLDRLLSLVDRR
jgi:nitronate monooxygenase